MTLQVTTQYVATKDFEFEFDLQGARGENPPSGFGSDMSNGLDNMVL